MPFLSEIETTHHLIFAKSGNIPERSVELSARLNYMTKQEMFNKAEQYKKIIQAARPLKPEELKELDAYFKIG